MTERYHDRVAVVTGGTTGIGRGIVERLIGEGAAFITAAVLDVDGGAVAKL